MTNIQLSYPITLASGTTKETLEALVSSARDHRNHMQIRTALRYAYLVWRLAMSSHATGHSRNWFAERLRAQAPNSATSRLSRRREVPYNLAVRVIFGQANPCKRHEVQMYASALKYTHARCGQLHITSFQPIDQALGAMAFKDAGCHEGDPGATRSGALPLADPEACFERERIPSDCPTSIKSLLPTSSVAQPSFSSWA